ncbi:DedA family protein [Candidatus Pacearchaeota archaeon]|nr:DedA family protein [Candidatus Pacearchaeota archaeon]
MSFISSLIESIISIIGDLGYLGIVLGMLIESSFIPFPSEVVLPPAGVLISRGEMSFTLVLLASIIGSLAGAYINYFLGLHFGRRIINKLVSKYGKFLFLKNETLNKADNYFKIHGSITTFTGRLIPAIRQLISIPAGFAKMPLGKFTLYTTLGSGIWSAILIYVGILYGNNKDKVDSMLSSITLWTIIILVIILAIYIYKKKKK